MKNFIALCIFAIGMFIMLPSNSSGSVSPPTSDQVCFVISSDVFAPAVSMQEEGGAAQQLEPANSTLGDVINVPAKASPLEEWLYWIIGVAVYVFYNFIARLIPTATSWTIPVILYKLGNLFIKDRSSTNGAFRIRNDTK